MVCITRVIEQHTSIKMISHITLGYRASVNRKLEI